MTQASRTPGIPEKAASTSAGWTFSPSGVTRTSLRRPRIRSRPFSSNSPTSPVCSHSPSIKLAGAPAPGPPVTVAPPGSAPLPKYPGTAGGRAERFHVLGFHVDRAPD